MSWDLLLDAAVILAGEKPGTEAMCSVQSARSAERMIGLLRDRYTVPTIYSDGDGGLVLLWERPSAKTFLIIGDGHLHALTKCGDDVVATCEDIPFSETAIPPALAVILRVYETRENRGLDMSDINQQIAGPLSLTRDADDPNKVIYILDDATDSFICTVDPKDQMSDEQAVANAALLALAYSAFDGSARKLGVDAADMAERLGPDGLAEITDVLEQAITGVFTDQWLAAAKQAVLKIKGDQHVRKNLNASSAGDGATT